LDSDYTPHGQYQRASRHPATLRVKVLGWATGEIRLLLIWDE
jgi:hypothetical protein